MRRKVSIVLVGVILLASMMFGGATAAETANYTAGTYTAAVRGQNGDVKVEVVFSDTAIESVTVVEQVETEHIAKNPIARIPADIVENQSLNVDMVTGATVTSGAILAAVTDCVTQAGGDVTALKAVPKPEVVPNAPVALETDVVVVGSGISGLSAAVEAVDNGAKVIVLEKLAAIGGSSSISGGKIQAAESSVQIAAGQEDTKEAYEQYLMEKSRDLADPEFVHAIAFNSADNIEWLIDMGVNFQPEMYELHAYIRPLRALLPIENKGFGITNPMIAYAESKGVEFLTETPAMSLIIEDGNVVGVNAVDATGGEVTVRADSVILATGGFDRNQELMDEYQPMIAQHTSSGVVSNTGDGLIMGLNAGAEMVAREGAIANGMDILMTFAGKTGTYQVGGTGLFVGPDGKRFVDENTFSFMRTAAMLDNGYTHFYNIFDQGAYVEELERAISMDRAFKADTLEELAGMIGADPEVFVATVERYNAMAEAGEDTDFGTPADFLFPVKEAPFYALLNTYMVSGTFGGLTTNIEGQVISTEGGVIPGLYAAGEVANGQYLAYEYGGSGTALISYLTMGRLAGAAAAAASAN